MADKKLAISEVNHQFLGKQHNFNWMREFCISQGTVVTFPGVVDRFNTYVNIFGFYQKYRAFKRV